MAQKLRNASGEKGEDGGWTMAPAVDLAAKERKGRKEKIYAG
jgi:hypothetical protein